MIKYDYAISVYFTTKIIPDCLHLILSEYGFSSTFLGLTIEYGKDVVEIYFETELSTSDKDDLDILIASYDPDNICHQDVVNDLGDTKINFTLTDNSTDYIANKIDKWKIAATFIYEGNIVWTPKRFSVIASLEVFGATGSVRLFDPNNNNELCIIDWTNESKLLLSTETFNNLPNSETLIEVQFKTSIKQNEARLHYLALY